MMRLPALRLGKHEDEDLTLSSAAIGVLLAVTFLYPVLLCAIFFPTPAPDLREWINLGRSFPLYTWKHPPLQAWASGVVALTGVRDSWLYVLAAQVLTFVGLGYLILTARKFIGREAEIPLIILFCGSVYYSLAIPSMALNADQLQIPLWAAVFYHALSAIRDNRWRDWLLCGVFTGVAFLAKYFVVALVALLSLAILAEPSYRRIFGNVRLYVAGLIVLPFVAFHVIPELSQRETAGYTAAAFNSDWVDRLWSLWHLLRSYVLYGLPALIGLAAISWYGGVTAPRIPRDPAQRVIVFSAAAFPLLLVLLIIFAGLRYTTRYSFPFFGLTLLALLCLVRIQPQANAAFARVMLVLWSAIIVGTVIYALIAINTILREPTAAAAVELRAKWEQQFPCGPAYLVGDTRSAWGIAINYGNSITGVGFEHTARPSWFDPDRARARGVIVVTTPDNLEVAAHQNWFDKRTPITLTLPYRHTLQSRKHTYVYGFVPPQDCAMVDAK